MVYSLDTIGKTSGVTNVSTKNTAQFRLIFFMQAKAGHRLGRSIRVSLKIDSLIPFEKALVPSQISTRNNLKSLMYSKNKVVVHGEGHPEPP